jgi:hypothetical protein
MLKQKLSNAIKSLLGCNAKEPTAFIFRLEVLPYKKHSRNQTIRIISDTIRK